MRKMKSGLPLATIFVLMVGGMTLWSLFKPDQIFSEQEKRYLAEKPQWSWKDVFSGSYEKDYEKYLSDQFPGRLFLTEFRTQAERMAGKQEISGVYLAADDYLIEHHEKKIFYSLKAEENMEKLQKILWKLQEHGIEEPVLLFVPSAEAVLRDHLSDFAPEAEEDRWYDVLKEEWEGKVPGKWCDLKRVLTQEAQSQEIFYRTDHHWTMYGAYTAYRSWAELSGFSPVSWEMYQKEIVKDDFYGSISARIRLNQRPDDLMICQSDTEYEVTYNDQGQRYESLYMPEKLNTIEPYAVYLNGNQPITRIIQKNPAKEVQGKKLLVLKDSFGNSMVPYMAEHFEETVMLDLRFRGLNLDQFLQKEEFTDAALIYNKAQFCQLDIYQP